MIADVRQVLLMSMLLGNRILTTLLTTTMVLFFPIQASASPSAIIDEIQQKESKVESLTFSIEALEKEKLVTFTDANNFQINQTLDSDIVSYYNFRNQYDPNFNIDNAITELEQQIEREEENIKELKEEAFGEYVIEYASQFEGNRYVWGGTDLENGIDCSGFVMRVYEHFGYSLPHSSAAQRSVGYAVTLEEIELGDIVCYPGHVGLYAGDGQIINASNSAPYPKGGIKYSDLRVGSIVAIRRLR